jgi:receptor-type tyrosine-protein phosphatase N
VFVGANGEEDDEMFSDFIKSYDPELGWGFKRPERLDVKKPGPFYKTNNFAFEVSYHILIANGELMTGCNNISDQ